MKTPRRSSKETIGTSVTSIPVGDAKALFDAVSQDNTKTITLGVPTEVVRQAPVRALGETEVSDHFSPLPEGVASTLLEQEDTQSQQLPTTFENEPPQHEFDLENAIDRAFENAGFPADVTTDQLIDQAVAGLEAEGINMDDLIAQGTVVMEQLMASIDTNGPTIPGTIEMDIEQDDGTIKHHVFDNPDRINHVVAMAQCDALIHQYDQQKLELATKPPVKPLRMGFFGWL